MNRNNTINLTAFLKSSSSTFSSPRKNVFYFAVSCSCAKFHNFFKGLEYFTYTYQGSIQISKNIGIGYKYVKQMKVSVPHCRQQCIKVLE